MRRAGIEVVADLSGNAVEATGDVLLADRCVVVRRS
jgi:hypothetical protein